MKKFYKCEGCDTIVGVLNAGGDDNLRFEGKLEKLGCRDGSQPSMSTATASPPNPDSPKPHSKSSAIWVRSTKLTRLRSKQYVRIHRLLQVCPP